MSVFEKIDETAAKKFLEKVNLKIRMEQKRGRSNIDSRVPKLSLSDINFLAGERKFMKVIVEKRRSY